jgi:hypothetical protein
MPTDPIDEVRSMLTAARSDIDRALAMIGQISPRAGRAKTPTAPAGWMWVVDIARRWRVPANSVYTLVYRRRLHGQRLDGRWAVRVKAVEAFERSGKAPVPATPVPEDPPPPAPVEKAVVVRATVLSLDATAKRLHAAGAGVIRRLIAKGDLVGAPLPGGGKGVRVDSIDRYARTHRFLPITSATYDPEAPSRGRGADDDPRRFASETGIDLDAT